MILVSLDKSVARFLVWQLVKKRKELGLSQREVAKLSGIRQPMIARIEKGKTIPRIDTFVKLCMVLDFHIQLLNTNIKENNDE